MEAQMSHQAMGYDRASIVFSPGGRLLQVEYAKKAVKQGTTAVGLVCKDGVLLVADRRYIDPLIVHSSVEKVMEVDSHIGATAVGYVMDGRVLIEKAQVMAQQHRVTYDEPMDVQTLVKEIANMKQAFTQYGGARPFGVSILFAGISDEGPELYVTDPTGIFFGYKATAVGELETEVREILIKEYKDGMNLDAGLKLAVRSLKKVSGKDFDLDKLDGAFLNTTDKTFTRMTVQDFVRLNK